MVKPTLVVMAAGMGSRYGGLKQIDPVGPNGEVIIDYSIYDAIKAGFGKVVFVIKKEIEESFRSAIGDKFRSFLEVDYVYQELTNVPSGFEVPQDRVKPWGTGHATLCSRNVVNTPFAVINADDFYGAESFREIGGFLTDARDAGSPYEYAMAGFRLERTLTEHGTVARGVCRVDDNNHLIGIDERTKIKKINDLVKYSEGNDVWVEIPENSTVSMNMWGFTPSIFDKLETGFDRFLKENRENILSAEYFLPTLVNRLIEQGEARVRVLPSNEQWYGVTYKEDKPILKEAIGRLIASGAYPEKLWGDK